jgi:histidinol-phosphate aminotransferase
MANIQPYVLSGSMQEAVRPQFSLDSNENPLGCSLAVQDVFRSCEKFIHHYPSGTARALRQAISTFYALPEEAILCGNGVEELIHLAARSFVSPGQEVIIPQYGFSVFRIATLAVGGVPVEAKRDNRTLTAKAISACLTPHTRMVFIDNPANPVGNYMPQEELRTLLKSLPPHVIVVIDAAYGEFARHEAGYTDGLPLLVDFPSLMVMKSFSKAYGLAGLRLGFVAASPALLAVMHKIRAPFNVNSLAQACGVAALADQDFINHTLDYVARTRTHYQERLPALGFNTWPTCTNFIMVDCGPQAQAIYQALLAKGIGVRPMATYDLPHMLRVSIGTPTAMEAFYNAMKELKNP